MRVMLVTDQDDLEGEMCDVADRAELHCEVVRARTLAGAALVAPQLLLRSVFVEQQLARGDEPGLHGLQRLLPSTPFVAIGGHAPWAVANGIGQLLQRPLHPRQLLLALDSDRLRIRQQPRVDAPAFPAASVPTLVGEAVALVGRHAATRMARDFHANRSKREAWHPWAPAFDWFFAGAGTPIPPCVTATAREMQFLKAIPRVLDEPDLRRKVTERIASQKEAAIYEATIAGGSKLLGYDAIWSAITGEDQADVLIRNPGPVEFQVKSRRPRQGDPMDPPKMLYQRLRDGADQTKKDRVAVVALVVSGGPDWQNWRNTRDGATFLVYVRDLLLREPRFSNVPVVLVAAGPAATGTETQQHVFQPAWQIFNVSTETRMPDGFGLFNTSTEEGAAARTVA